MSYLCMDSGSKRKKNALKAECQGQKSEKLKIVVVLLTLTLLKAMIPFKSWKANIWHAYVTDKWI